jgi:hypothetical protein
MSRQIDISDLPQPVVDALETIIRAYRERAATTPTNDKRPIGWARDYLPALPESFLSLCRRM